MLPYLGQVFVMHHPLRILNLGIVGLTLITKLAIPVTGSHTKTVLTHMNC